VSQLSQLVLSQGCLCLLSPLLIPSLTAGQGGRYKLRAKVDVADVSDEHSVWVRFGTDAEGAMQPSASAPRRVLYFLLKIICVSYERYGILARRSLPSLPVHSATETT